MPDHEAGIKGAQPGGASTRCLGRPRRYQRCSVQEVPRCLCELLVHAACPAAGLAQPSGPGSEGPLVQGSSALARLEGQLAPVQHSAHELVLLLLEVRLGALARPQQLLQDLWQDALAQAGLHEQVSAGALLHLLRWDFVLPAARSGSALGACPKRPSNVQGSLGQ